MPWFSGGRLAHHGAARGRRHRAPGLSRIARFVAWAACWAGVLEALVFAVVDPRELRWFGAAPAELSAQAVYSASFLTFWGVCAPDVKPARRAPGWPR